MRKSALVDKSLSGSVEGTSPAGRVVRAARESFLQRGFRSVSMDELAQALGMSKRTIYEIFPDKESLVQAVVNQKLSEIETELEALTSERGMGFLRLSKELFSCVYRHTSEIQPAFVHDIRRHAPGVFSAIEVRRRALIERHIERLIRKGQSSGDVRSDVPARFFVQMTLASVSSLVTPQKMEELGMTPREGLMAVFSVVFEGLLTEKGRKML